LHAGDQVLSLDGYAVNRKDFWALEYYRNALAPKNSSTFELRAPDGSRRSELVVTARGADQRMAAGTTLTEIIDSYKKRLHHMRERWTEIDDVMFWNMRQFFAAHDEIDYLIGIARKHQTLILDLRGNSGGSEETLRYLIGSLIDHETKICTRVTRKGSSPLTAKPNSKDVFTGRLIVLVDAGSASASEVLARVVQLERRGTVAGDRTEGGVMESKAYPFEYGVSFAIHFGAFIISADLVMSDGKSLEKVGVTPDVLILPTAADLAAGLDPVLAKTAELARVKLDPAAAGKMFPYEWPPE
jgi:peptidase S41-like protein